MSRKLLPRCRFAITENAAYLARAGSEVGHTPSSPAEIQEEQRLPSGRVAPPGVVVVALGAPARWHRGPHLDYIHSAIGRPSIKRTGLPSGL